MKKRKMSQKTRLLMHHLRKAAPAFALGIAAAMAVTLLNMAFLQIVRFTVDMVLMGDVSLLPQAEGIAPDRLLIIACSLAVVVAAVQFVAGYLQDSSLPRASEQFVKSLRDALYTHIQQLPFSWHAKNPTGDIIQRCTSDVEKVRTFIMDQVLELMGTVFLIAVYMVVMFTMNVKISLVALAFVPAVVLYSVAYYRRIASRFTEVDEAEGALSTVVQENLTGVRVVRAFGRERDELAKFREKNDHYTNLWLELGSTMSTFWTMGDLMSILQILSVILLGVTMCVRGGDHAGHVSGVHRLHAQSQLARARPWAHCLGDEQGRRVARPPALHPGIEGGGEAAGSRGGRPARGDSL